MGLGLSARWIVFNCAAIGAALHWMAVECRFPVAPGWAFALGLLVYQWALRYGYKLWRTCATINALFGQGILLCVTAAVLETGLFQWGLAANAGEKTYSFDDMMITFACAEFVIVCVSATILRPAFKNDTPAWAEANYRKPQRQAPPAVKTRRAWLGLPDLRHDEAVIERLCKEAGWVLVTRSDDLYQVRARDHRSPVNVEIRYSKRHGGVVFQGWFSVRFPLQNPPSGLFAKLLLRNTSLTWTAWGMSIGGSCEACLSVGGTLAREALDAALFGAVCGEIAGELLSMRQELHDKFAYDLGGGPLEAAPAAMPDRLAGWSETGQLDRASLALPSAIRRVFSPGKR